MGGGDKQSARGREWGHEMLTLYLETTSVCIGLQAGYLLLRRDGLGDQIWSPNPSPMISPVVATHAILLAAGSHLFVIWPMFAYVTRCMPSAHVVDVVVII